jgi:DNA-binding response OmpR family regulator
VNGLELLREVKQRRPDLPVMMVTVYGDNERRRRASELGASEFLTKPVDFDRLKAKAAASVSGSGLRNSPLVRMSAYRLTQKIPAPRRRSAPGGRTLPPALSLTNDWNRRDSVIRSGRPERVLMPLSRHSRQFASSGSFGKLRR